MSVIVDCLLVERICGMRERVLLLSRLDTSSLNRTIQLENLLSVKVAAPLLQQKESEEEGICFKHCIQFNVES